MVGYFMPSSLDTKRFYFCLAVVNEETIPVDTLSESQLLVRNEKNKGTIV